MDINYKFKLKDQKSEKPTSIRMLFYKDGKRFIYGTGKTILPQLWNNEEQIPTKDKKVLKSYSKQFPQLKTELENIENRNNKIVRLSKEWFAKIELTNDVPDLEKLREYLNLNLRTQNTSNSIKPNIQKIYIDDVIRTFIRDITNGTKFIQRNNRNFRYKEGTIKVYRSLLKSFTELQEYTKQRYCIEDVTSTLSEQWSNYLFKEKNSSASNVGKYHKHFKSVISDKLKKIDLDNYSLEKQGKQLLLSDRQIKRIELGLKSFKNITSRSTQVYLTQEEIESIESLANLEKHLEKARDLFLCGCYTAMRFSDYSKMGPEHIKSENGISWIDKITDKMGNKVKVPIKRELQQILEKYNNQLPKMSEQKVNKYIKEVCKKAGINEVVEKRENKGGIDVIKKKFKYELVTTHTARRTGATLLHLDGHPYKDIMVITGHDSIKSFETYLRTDNEGAFKRMLKSKFFSNSLKKV